MYYVNLFQKFELARTAPPAGLPNPGPLLPQSLRRAKTLSPFGLAALTLSGKGKRFIDLS